MARYISYANCKGFDAKCKGGKNMKITGKTKEQILQEKRKQEEIVNAIETDRKNFKKVIYLLIKNSNIKLNKTDQKIIDDWIRAYEFLEKENLL